MLFCLLVTSSLYMHAYQVTIIVIQLLLMQLCCIDDAYYTTQLSNELHSDYLHTYHYTIIIILQFFMLSCLVVQTSNMLHGYFLEAHIVPQYFIYSRI